MTELWVKTSFSILKSCNTVNVTMSHAHVLLISTVCGHKMKKTTSKSQQKPKLRPKKPKRTIRECESKCEPHRLRYKMIMILVFLWDRSPFHMTGGWIQTRQSSRSGGCGKCGGRGCGEVLGREGIADAEEGREIRLCIKQTELSTLQVSFHQCNFCQQNNRKGKGKVHQLLVKHQAVKRWSNTNTVLKQGQDWGRGLSKREPEGKDCVVKWRPG